MFFNVFFSIFFRLKVNSIFCCICCVDVSICCRYDVLPFRCFVFRFLVDVQAGMISCVKLLAKIYVKAEVGNFDKIRQPF